MDIITTAADSAWKVLLAGLFFGAGLPALFSIGMVSLSYAEPETASPNVSPAAAKAGAAVCFGIVLVAVITGVLFLTKATIKHYFGISLF